MSEKTPNSGKPAPSNVMADLLSKSKVAGATPCPNCSSYLEKGASVCTRCGYNESTGKSLGTRVIDAPKERGPKKASGDGIALDPMMGVWAMVVVLGLLTVGVFVSPPLFFLYYAVVYLYMTAAWWIGASIGAFMDQRSTWGIVMLIPLLNLLGIYYMATQSARPALKGHYFTALLFAIAAPVLASSFLTEATEQLGIEPDAGQVAPAD